MSVKMFNHFTCDICGCRHEVDLTENNKGDLPSGWLRVSSMIQDSTNHTKHQTVTDICEICAIKEETMVMLFPAKAMKNEK